MIRAWLLRANVWVALAALMSISLAIAAAQDNPSKSEQVVSARDTAFEAWRVEMNYVQTNRPHRVNGFLTGSGSGQIGTIRVKHSIANINNDTFTCSLIEPINADDEGWSSFVADNHSWSMSDVQLNDLAYPVLAMVKTSNGTVFTIVPATFNAKVDIAVGAILHSNGYAIESKRAIKAGDLFNVLRVGNNIFSVEAVEGTNYDGKAEPWFVVLVDSPK